MRLIVARGAGATINNVCCFDCGCYCFLGVVGFVVVALYVLSTDSYDRLGTLELLSRPASKITWECQICPAVVKYCVVHIQQKHLVLILLNG